MKKIILLLILLCPILVSAECDQNTIDNLRSQISNVSFNLEYNDVTLDSGEKENYFNVSVIDLPQDFIVRLNDGDVIGYVLENGAQVTVNGGVYYVEFLNLQCHGDLIDSYTMMIPYYEKSNENVWFDGTYGENKTTIPVNKTTMKNASIYLIAGGLVALLLIIVICAILIKRRRKIK